MERFFIADPYNDNHINLIVQFEEENQIPHETSALLKNIRSRKFQPFLGLIFL